MKYKCIIFDLDGTLIDSLPGIIEACNITFKELGMNEAVNYEQAKAYIGGGATIFTKRALKHLNLTQEEEKKILSIYLKNYEITQKTAAKPFPNVNNLLLKLKKRGYLLCIASNKPHDLLKQIVNQLFPEIAFDCTLGQKPNTPEKPDPYVVFEILKELNLKQSECVYVGDSKYDVETANNAGLDSIIVTYGYGFYNEPWINKATKVVPDLDELSKLLN